MENAEITAGIRNSF